MKYILAVVLAVVLLSCAGTSVTADRPIAAAATPSDRDASDLHFIFAGGHRCRLQACGCTFGGALGGTGALERMYREYGATPEKLIAVWGGTTFRCDRDASAGETAEMTADTVKRMPVAAVAPSSEDLLLGVARIRALQQRSGKPWVLSNVTVASGKAPWTSSLDIRRGAGHLRFYAIAWPPLPPKSGLRFESPSKALRKLFALHDDGALNVVIVSTADSGVVMDVAALPGAHLVLDGEEATRETLTGRALDGDRLRASVRGRGQAAFHLRLWPESTFTGFYSEIVANAVRLERAFGDNGAGGPSLSMEKRPGLWRYSSDLRLLGN